MILEIKGWHDWKRTADVLERNGYVVAMMKRNSSDDYYMLKVEEKP